MNATTRAQRLLDVLPDVLGLASPFGLEVLKPAKCGRYFLVVRHEALGRCTVADRIGLTGTIAADAFEDLAQESRSPLVACQLITSCGLALRQYRSLSAILFQTASQH